MSIKKRFFQGSKQALTFLEDLACDTNEIFVFRGQSNPEDRLENSLQRYRKIPHDVWMSDIDDALKKYKAGLDKLGINSFDRLSRLEALEHARHHGVPAPCLDFSYSPYVALFFAFNRIRMEQEVNKKNYSVIFALSVNQLAAHWAKSRMHIEKYERVLRNFMHPDEELFAGGYPEGQLQLIPHPASRNPRMHKQMGVFIYDTLDYKQLEMRDLEDYIDRIPDDVADGNGGKVARPTLYKIYINHTCAGNIFQRLELMNITGGSLYGDADGVAMDIVNSYNYKPKTFYLRDPLTPVIDDIE